ncbi:MAG: thermonuclease family protein [Candidatus Azobacteroides sp.]|nr:thermonuclease family protein [Candidatus Azobacteroides sp.]
MKNILLVLVLFISCSFTPERIVRGKIVKVSDGDTVTLLTKENEQIKIRLDGIDAPENGQDYGEKSRQFLADLIAGKEVELHVTGTDRYKRTLGFIYINGKNVNEALVRNGLAWHYKHFNNDPKLDSLEQLARKEKLNIWSQKNPIEPYEFRKAKKNNQKKSSDNTQVKKNTTPATLCGARTKNGSTCKRKVSGGGYCWQHSK